jgi:hypothetical protein
LEAIDDGVDDAVVKGSVTLIVVAPYVSVSHQLLDAVQGGADHPGTLGLASQLEGSVEEKVKVSMALLRPLMKLRVLFKGV